MVCALINPFLTARARCLTCFGLNQSINNDDSSNSSRARGEGGPVDIGVVEGRIREHFLSRDAMGYDVLLSDVIVLCRKSISDKTAALAMAERVSKWLHGRGVRVWQ